MVAGPITDAFADKGGKVPTNTSPPTISGSAQEGSALTANTGTWAGPQITFTYTWRRCDSGGLACGGIQGASGRTYLVAAGDIGSTIRVVVTGTNSSGSTSATSGATGVVQPAPTPPVNTTPPAISGTAQQGQTLTGDPGSWSGTAPISYAYQWQRCDSGGSACAAITGATAQTYGLAAADVTFTIRVAVTASNAGGASTASSAPTGAVLPPPASAPSNTSVPTISGTVQQGAQLLGNPGTWSGSPPISYGYQWGRCDSAGAGCVDIAGATTNTYTIIPVDGGSTLRLQVTASNSAGSSTASSAATPVVPSATGPTNTAPPSITGTTQQGGTLTANPGTWEGTAPITYAYQWRRCNASYRDTVLATAPVAYWRLGESSGSSAADISGNGNSGTYGNSYLLAQPGALASDPDTAVRFTGTPSTGDVVVPHGSSLSYGDNVSYEAWVQLATLPPSTSAGANIITKNVGSMLMRIYPSGIFALRKSGGNEIARSSAALTADGRYHQLVGTKSGATIHLYLDGVDVTTAVVNQSLTSNTSQLVIGHNPISTNDGLDGFIDEVAVYDHGLSAAEVSGHYSAGTQPNCSDVSGATGTSYALTSADVGFAMRITVTATNSAGSTSASSAPTTIVTAAATVGWTSYRDQPIADAGIAPTGSKPESKLWWNDGSWWASMWSSAGGFHIFKLSGDHQTWVDTGVQLDDRGGTRADVLWDGAHLYVASHVFSACGCSTSAPGHPARLYRYSYDGALKTYSLDSGFPVTINDTSTETLVIDKDSTGSIWATWAQDNVVQVAHTLGGDQSWGAPYALPVTGAATLNGDDISSVVAFGGSKIGIMWSNQTDSAMYFSVHVDGTADSAWSVSRNAVPGPNYADDHISLRSLQADGSGRIFAAVKTSLDSIPNPNPNAPLIMLLVRDPGTGDWSNNVFGRVGDNHTRSIVMIDEQNNVIHMFATSPVTGGGIYEKTSPLNAISFASGLGTRVLFDPNSLDMNNVTSTKQNVNSTTGLVILASNDTTQPTTSYPSPTGGYYWHAYEDLSP